jgi:hypothetical protein
LGPSANSGSRYANLNTSTAENVPSHWAAALYGSTNLGLWSGIQTRRSTAMSHYPSCAKASRSLFSCSSGRLVEMISKS